MHKTSNFLDCTLGKLKAPVFLLLDAKADVWQGVLDDMPLLEGEVLEKGSRGD